VPQTPPDPSAVIGQLLTFSLKLAEALDDAEALGGLGRLRGKMKPSTAAKLVAELKQLRADLDEQLGLIDKPDGRLIRRQANKPVPIPTVR
jgi:hypothetical protein